MCCTLILLLNGISRVLKLSKATPEVDAMAFDLLPWCSTWPPEGELVISESVRIVAPKGRFRPAELIARLRPCDVSILAGTSCFSGFHATREKHDHSER